ncbi:MAG: MaoC family dehydratase [Acidimicrobiales bacterium]
MREPRQVTTRALGPDFAVGPAERYFEDYVPGALYEYGERPVSEREIIEFATAYDPQDFHVDADAAAAGPFGGLIASGFHSAALAMRLLADHYVSWVASLGSPGLEALAWPAPLRPGDRVRLRAEVLEARASASKPDRGIVRTRVQLLTDRDLMVVEATIVNLLARRPSSP